MSKNILKVITIFLIVAILAVSLIVSQNNHHLEICHEEHCVSCTAIHIAQNIISLTIVFIVAIMVGFFIYFFLSRLHKEPKICTLISLVFQKVQFNE